MEVNEFIRQLFDRAKAYGFTAAEAHYSTGEEFTVGVQAGQIIDYSVSSSQGLTFRGNPVTVKTVIDADGEEVSVLGF